jgi:hypothetical protein
VFRICVDLRDAAMTLHALVVDSMKLRSLSAFRLVLRLMLVDNHPTVP